MAQVTWLLPGEGTQFPIRWKSRVRAWWEGYDLSQLKPGEATEKVEEAVAAVKQMEAVTSAQALEPLTTAGRPLWSAGRVKVAETLWGQDFLSPGGVEHTAYLVKPFGINSKMSILDLAAGLGGVARTIARDYKAWVTGMEPSPMLAQMAMERSEKQNLSKQAPVESYDPNHLNLTRRYDGIFAKESFFTVENKDQLFDRIATGLKDGGQFLFTDYCIDKSDPNSPQLLKWIAGEPVTPHLWTVEHIVKALKIRKLDVRTNEDITDLQRRLILRSLGHFLEHLETHTMDVATKNAVLDEVELWARRMAAFDAGLRVYRFYCMKH